MSATIVGERAPGQRGRERRRPAARTLGGGRPAPPARPRRRTTPVKLLLPDSLPLDPPLPEGVVAVRYDASAPVPDEHLDAEALVVWGSSPADVSAVAGRMPRL